MEEKNEPVEEKEEQKSLFDDNAGEEKKVAPEAKEAPSSEVIKEPERPKIKKDKKRSGAKWLLIFLVIIFFILVGAFLGYLFYDHSNEFAGGDETTTTTSTNTTTSASTTTTTKPASVSEVYVNSVDGLNLRSTASATGTLLATMPFGTKLTILEESDGWIKVEYDGQTGWCSKDYTGSENPLVYKNEDYGFQVTFPEGWETYKLFPIADAGDGVEAAYYVALKTTDTTYTTETGVDAGYGSLFAIDVYTKTQWTEVESQGGPMPIKAAENDQYVIGYSLANGIPPSDLTAQREDASEVAKTTKFY